MVALLRPQASPQALPIWGAILELLRHKLAAPALEEVERSVRFVDVDATSVRLAIPAGRVPAWLQGGQLAPLDAAVTEVSDAERELAVVPVSDEPLPLDLDPTHTLARFTTGPSNQRARDVALGLCRQPPEGPNPLLIHGPERTGKTHLLRAIAQGIATARPGVQVHCSSAVQLSLDLISAMHGRRLEEFERRCASWDALLVDDVDELEGRESTQEELLRAQRTLVDLGASVVLTSRAPLDAVPGLSEELRAAAPAAACVELSRPSWEMKVAIVLDRIDRWGVQADAEVASFIVSRLGAKFSRVDALLTRLLGHPLCAGGPIDVEGVRQVLGSSRAHPGPVPPETVVTLIARHFNLRIRDLRSATRSPRITTPRQIAMYLLRRHCSLSYPEIGLRFGRHHTTALHSVRQVSRQLEENGSLRASVRLLEKELLRSLEEGE